MSPDQVEVARGLAAEPDWTWRPGMQVVSPVGTVLRLLFADEGGGRRWWAAMLSTSTVVLDGFPGWTSLEGCIPDLSDELTLAGLLPYAARSVGAHVVLDVRSVSAGELRSAFVRVAADLDASIRTHVCDGLTPEAAVLVGVRLWRARRGFILGPAGLVFTRTHGCDCLCLPCVDSRAEGAR